MFEWLGSIMMLVALIEFAQNPKKAVQSIPGVLQTNVQMEGTHLVLHRTEKPKKNKLDNQ